MSDAWRDTYDAWKLRSDRDEEEDTDMNQPEPDIGEFAVELTNLVARHLESGVDPDEIAAALQEALEGLGEDVNDEAEANGDG